MNRFLRPSSVAWLALVVGAAGWIAFAAGQRAAQIEKTGATELAVAADATSPTGYARGTRGLLLPAESATSQPWIMDVQQMMATGSWRITHADYDNAPEGRPVEGPTLYRWWLRIVAQAELALGAKSAGVAVERAALHADPALHFLLCLGAGLFVSWRFGAAAGGFLALGIAALFSHAQVFAAGQPDDHGLFLVTALGSLLLLLAGWQSATERAARGWLFAAGAFGGVGLWLDAGSQLVVIGAILAGGLAVIGWPAPKGSAPVKTLPWLAWAAGGAMVAIAGWFIDGRPGGIAGLNPGANHPLLVLAWFGVAGILGAAPGLKGSARRNTSLRLAVAGIAVVVPLAWLWHHSGANASFGPAHPALAGRGGLLDWFRNDGLTGSLVAALLPVLLVPAGLGLMQGAPQLRTTLRFALGCAGVLLVASCVQLRWWGVVDATLLGLLAVVVAAFPGGLFAVAWRAGLAILLLPGLAAAWPRANPDETLAPTEARALVERDLAQWLAIRLEPGATAFAPPALSASLCYYGGLRVIASPYPGNQDGLALASHIAGTPAADEAQALIQRRGVRYIVLPSWDDSLDRLARLGSETPERSLIAMLRQWLPPRWLRPVAYQMPVIPGLEKDSVAVFEVVEPQENAVALSRLAEYFLETGRIELAGAVAESLEKSFAADAGAMVARAQVALARGDGGALARVMPELLPSIADGRDEDLPWERRASLAIVLAQTKHADLARLQVDFCLKEADAERLRSLGPVSLYRLLAIARAYRVEFADPTLGAAALDLLPAEFRAQLGP